MRIKDFVKCNLNNLFYREYRLRRKVRRHLLPYYKEAFPVGKNTNKMIVFMADGRKSHGGLADRLRGIVSTYEYCLNHRVEFRIKFKSPKKIEDLLIKK